MVAPKHVKACPGTGTDLWFVDDPSLLIMRQNWEKDILDELMNRTKYCDIDECLTSPCDPDAICTNNPGSFNCTCNAGFTGDGLNCSVCSVPLGMESGEISNGGITASVKQSGFGANSARLNSSWAWQAYDSSSEWIQAKLRYQTYVWGVITQGDGGAGPDNNWVTTFKVSTFLSTNVTETEVYVMNQDGDEIIFPGNTDTNTKVTTTFPAPVYALIVRITCLTANGSSYGLRFEILGCKV
ncbi:EGF-like repeat and discoidin I-like domain-containing protein 3 [Amphiura filiformis]|uniref:EGF-like repeat and discoidin I-like domain-containing protein 3 n=1 Tax=Amphiura filiformis TaxID=82378 RepID=UPI003B21954A